MRLLGRDIDAPALLRDIAARLQQRGLDLVESAARDAGVESRVDPLTFNLEAMGEHADSAKPLPLETHRGGLGRAVLLAKWAFRKSCQVLINETLARQQVFNGHARDAYGQLSAQVLELKRQVARLEEEKRAPPAKKKPAKPVKKK